MTCTDYRIRAASTKNNLITLYMLPFIPLHFLCTHWWQLVHCIELLPTPLPHHPLLNYNLGMHLSDSLLHFGAYLLLQLFFVPCSGSTRVSRYQKQHSPTHLSWSSSNLYQLLSSTTIHSILPVQITCLTTFLHNLSPSPLWSTSWSWALHLILHRFLYPTSVLELNIV